MAAIDIGSNAARLLISDVRLYKDGSPDFTKVSLIRVPLRLGFEVFEAGKVSSGKRKKMLDTLRAYKHLIKVFDVEDFRAVATSAMRDASNGSSIVKQIAKEVGIQIEIIQGEEEAGILIDAEMSRFIDRNKTYVYVDVGGGSTEIIFLKKQKVIDRKSFNVGTIRILTEQLQESEWERMKEFVKNSCMDSGLKLIGSGGNINKVFSLSKQKVGKPLSRNMVREYYKVLSKLSIEDRMHTYSLREDRADVIVPALKIYSSIMRWGNFPDILVPQVGLVDGIVKKLFTDNSFSSLKALHK